MSGFPFLDDQLFWIAALAAFAASVVRGFSGFGAGLIFVPIAAACYGPRTAAGVLFIIDSILIVPFVVKAVRIVDWRELGPLGIGAVAAVPLGVSALLVIDPVAIRWGISLTILASVSALAAGWRYHGPTRTWLSLLVGSIAGFLSGAAQIPGPPVLIYWLGRSVVSATMRANAFVFFGITTLASGTAFAFGGIFTDEVLRLSLALLPVYGVGILIGGRMYGLASERVYRHIAYASILFAATASMPFFD